MPELTPETARALQAERERGFAVVLTTSAAATGALAQGGDHPETPGHLCVVKSPRDPNVFGRAEAATEEGAAILALQWLKVREQAATHKLRLHTQKRGPGRWLAVAVPYGHSVRTRTWVGGTSELDAAREALHQQASG